MIYNKFTAIYCKISYRNNFLLQIVPNFISISAYQYKNTNNPYKYQLNKGNIHSKQPKLQTPNLNMKSISSLFLSNQSINFY